MRVCLIAACLLGAQLGAAQGQSGGESQILRRASALEEQGEYDKAKGVYLDALGRFPKSSEILFHIGILYLRESNWQDAIPYLEQAHDVRPRHVDTLYYLGQAYYLDGQHMAARKSMLRAVTLAPSRPDLAQKYGEYLCEDNLCKEGLRYLLKARRLDPTLQNIDFDLGMAYHKQAAVPEARRYLEIAIKKDPNNLIAARFLADVYGREGKWDRAKDLYQLVVDRDRRNAWALYGLGRAWMGLANYQAAIGPLRDAIGADPTIAESHFQLAQALRQLGQREEAQRELGMFQALRDRTQASAAVAHERTPFEERIWQTCRKLLEENKESEALSHLNSLKTANGAVNSPYLLGALYFAMRRASDAARMFSQATNVSPADPNVWAYLGRAYVAAGQYPSAEKALARARELNPQGELALIGMGELCYARENWPEAVRYFELSKTRQVPALLKLCRAYFKMGDRDKGLVVAELVRAFGNGDTAALAELDAILSSEKLALESATSQP
ncbi:MAG TPA: tetratricopeptide repeat protein [Terriglobales bacterium]|jgi:tetratricopeptide (TPR) repeat protein